MRTQRSSPCNTGVQPAKAHSRSFRAGLGLLRAPARAAEEGSRRREQRQLKGQRQGAIVYWQAERLVQGSKPAGLAAVYGIAAGGAAEPEERTRPRQANPEPTHVSRTVKSYLLPYYLR